MTASWASMVARVTLNDLPWELAEPPAHPSVATLAPASRRTVRIVHERSTDSYAVLLAEPGDIEGGFHCSARGLDAKQWCAERAVNLACHHNLDITRVEIP